MVLSQSLAITALLRGVRDVLSRGKAFGSPTVL